MRARFSGEMEATPNQLIPMQPVQILLEPHVAGDTWEGISSIGPVLFDGAAPPHVLVKAWIYFKEGDNYPPCARVATAPDAGEAPILLLDPAAWSLSVPPVAPALFPLTPGNWKWSFKTIDAAGILRTLYHGVLEVTP